MARRDRLKQGEEAKQRVMERLSGGGVSSAPPTSSRRIDRLMTDDERKQRDTRNYQQVQENFNTARQQTPELFSPFQEQQAVKETFKSAPTKKEEKKPSERQQWMDEQRRQRDESVKPGMEWTRSKPFVALETGMDYLMSLPGIAAFQKGAGDALAIETDTAPITGSPLINAPARIAGNIAGALTNPTNIAQGLVNAPYQIGGQLALSKAGQAITRGNPLAATALRGATAGAIQGGVLSGARRETDADEMARNVGIGAALGGAGDVALAGLGRAVSSLFKRNGLPEEAAQEILALPAPKQRGNANTATTPDVMPSFGGRQLALPEPSPLGLPEPSIAPATTARMGQQSNPYRQQFEGLMQRAQQLQSEGRFTPGREDADLESLWSQMAGRDGVSLDELIQRAYPTRKSKVAPDLVQQARSNQYSREVAGAPLPVRTRAERLINRQGVVSSADAPVERVGRAPQSAQPEVMPSQQQPLRARTEVNPETTTAITRNSADDLKELHKMGAGIIDGMYDSLWKKVNTGGVTENGQPSALLQVAKVVRDNGGLKTRAEFVALAKEVTDARSQGLTGKAYQDALKQVASRYIPFETSKPSGSLAGDLKDSLKAQPNSGFSGLARRGNEYDRSALDSTKSQLVTKTTKPLMTPREAVESGYRKMVDDFYRFKDFDNLAKRTLGRELKPSEQAHTLALNSRGSDMITRHALTENMVDINGNVTGRSLKNASQQIPKNKLIDFEDYQVLKHALWRMQRGEKVYRDELGMDLNKVAQRVFDYETQNPDFKTINEEFLKYSENLTKNWLLDTGILSRKQFDGYLENNPFYAPNMRQFDDIENRGGRGARSGFSQGNPIKKGVGSERRIISPTESRIEQTDQYIKAGKRNQVMQSVVSMAQKDPEAFEGFIEVLPMTDNMKHKALGDINGILERDGVDGLINNLNENFDELFNAAKQSGRKDMDNVIPVMINGEPLYVRVNDAPFLDALTALTPQAQGVVLEAARQTTRIMKLLTTGVNPIFSITRNLIRDIPMAYVASKTTNNPLRFTWDLMDSVVKILGNKDLYQSFKSVGGGHSSSIAADRNLLAQSKAAVLPQRNRLKNAPGRALGAIENFTNALETAPRLGEYKRITKAGGDSADSRIKGLYEANDVTVNFKRRGNVGREIDAFVPYFNAAIQGLDKTFRTAKDKPVAAALKAIGAITVPTLVTYALNYNNPDYKKLDNRTKDLYYLLPNGDGTFTKLPKPREYGAVFGSGVERVLRKWQQDDPQAFKGFMETVRYSFTPPILAGATAPGLSVPERLESSLIGDTILGPLSDIRANKDFANRPIVPGYMEGSSPKLQYDERTSELSKWVGNKLNNSPKQLDYLLKSYTGIIGQVGIPLSSEGGSIMKMLKNQVTADPTYSNGISAEFYEMKDKLETAYQDYKETGEASVEFNEPLRKYFSDANSNMSDVRTAMRQIQSDKSIPAKQKETKLKELQNILNAIGEDANRVAFEQMNAMKRQSR